MRSDDCLRFEAAIGSESAIEETLLQHADSCLECRILAQLRDFSVAPLTTDQGDPFRRRVLATAADLAMRRAARWKRDRRTVALSLGITGYILAAATFLLGPSSLGNGRSALTGRFEVHPLAVPPPDLTSIVVVLMVSVVWITVLAFVSRSRLMSTAES